MFNGTKYRMWGKLKACLTFLFYIVCSCLAYGQYKGSSVTVGSTYGWDMVHAKTADKTNSLYGVQVQYARGLSHIDEEWIKTLNAKYFAANLLWTDMQSMHEKVGENWYNHGHAIGLSAGVGFQLYQIGLVGFFLKPEVGLTYITKNIKTQPETSTVGSAVNISLGAQLGIDIPLREDWGITTDVGVLHYSNGGASIPNGGINAFRASLGLRKSFGTAPDQNAGVVTGRKKAPFKHLEGGHAELMVGLGVRGQYRSSDKKLYRSGIFTGYSYFVNPAIAVKAGADMVYYYTIYDAERHEETFQYFGSSYERVRVGLSGGLDIAMGRFVANGMVGRYLYYKSYYEDIRWYWTTGLRYYITTRIGVQSTLYMHRMQADFINWGLAFKM